MHILLKLLPLLAVLAGCTTPSPRPPVPDQSGRPEVAQAAMQSGDYFTAARVFSHLAVNAEPPLRQTYQLGAVEALLAADLEQQASQLLVRVDRTGLSARDYMRARILDAHIALKSRQPETTLQRLNGPLAPATEPALAEQHHRLRALAYGQLGNHLEAAREYVLRGAHISEPTLRAENEEGIWQSLSMLTETALQALQSGLSDELNGWMELTLLVKRSQREQGDFSKALAQWRDRYQGHPADQGFLSDMLKRSRELMVQARHVAVLLPLSGRFGQAAAAVRDGILAAHYDNPRRAEVRLRIHDVTESHLITAVYDQAVREGADFVIGPLDKDALEQLAAHKPLPVPILALNNTDYAVDVDALFQFALAPEDEARQVAERAWVDGNSRAGLVIPEGAWGERVGRAFADRWVEFGGVIASRATYDGQKSDFGRPLQALLALDSSQQRRRELERLFGKSLEFQPRRRQDLDFLFVVASPRQARLIRPQLKFHHAGDLPVYSTSHIFEGAIRPDQDRDMDGMVFGDMPHVLKGTNISSLERYNGQLRRLVALGMDAYNLLPSLRILERYPNERFQGVTGSLRVNEEQRIKRQVMWARFVGGRPQVIEAEARGRP